jgi:signal transduction histidine kinase
MKTSLFLLFTALHFNSIPVQAQEVEQSTILVAERTKEKITVDGFAGEAIWKKAKRLIAGVQDGGIGNIEVFIQAAYDREKIYFFIRWPDATKNVLKRAWVYDAKIRQWRSKLKDKRLPGKWIKPDEKIENEDRFTIMWNIDNSIMGFNSFGCKITCHGDRKHTNAPNERADTWHWKSVRTNPLNYIDDKWLSDKIVFGYEYEDIRVARQGDSYDKTAGLAEFGGNYAFNSQAMTIRGKQVEVPLCWEPNATAEDALFITQEEIINGEAVKITDLEKLDRSRSIPGFILFRPQGSRGDIDAKGVWGDGFWNLEFSRKRKTGNPDDVQFDVTQNYRFGVAVMDNSGGYQAFRRGHSFSTRPYTMQFGGVASQITSHLLTIKDYVTMSRGYVKKRNHALALSELNHAQMVLDEIEEELAVADPERFLKLKRSFIQTHLQLKEKNLKSLDSDINDFIYLIQGKVSPAPPSWLSVVMMAWIKIQSYIFVIISIFAVWLLISLIEILKKKAWKRMGVFLFLVIAPIFLEGIGRLGILTGLPFLNYLSFTTNEYARLIFALLLTLAILYSRLGFRDLNQAEVELKNEISIRKHAEKSLREAHDELEVRVEKRTADLAETNKKLQAEINEHKQTEKELKRSREAMQGLSSHLQSVRECERANVAREIHDELGQILTGLQIDFSNLMIELPQEKETLIEKGKELAELIDRSIITVQRISEELRPSLLDKLGLAPAIEWHAEEFQNRIGIKCEVTYEADNLVLSWDRSLAIFRIFQEALTNVARHADATLVKTDLKKEKDCLILKVMDNGKGITNREAFSPKSFGIAGMNERALFVGGEFKIDGVMGKGTTITVIIPLSRNKEKT